MLYCIWQTNSSFSCYFCTKLGDKAVLEINKESVAKLQYVLAELTEIREHAHALRVIKCFQYVASQSAVLSLDADGVLLYQRSHTRI